ncbi:hypothetical protein [Actinomycetia phage DSL-LC01]|nr:hypothetical protein [Actinomycetia phage DSL-LC01]
MPGFLGGSSSGGGGAGGEISFPKEFIDPVTKFRVSEPENLIDTDFEYGLQPTKWETLELINNTPSFFSKSGDTTIPNISAISTITGSREITVTTSLDHGLSVGTPITVTGTKSLTADGSYIINSIPTARTFTYLAKENQFQTASIEDLYTGIATGEFFQGSQIKISDARGLETDAGATSILTVQTDSPHGFGVNTPFYFLNLNSSISLSFDSTNTEAKSFDASNSAVARSFDGSNSIGAVSVDFSNRASSSDVSVASSVSAVDTVANTITVTHTTENFSGRLLATPLQYNVVASSGFFFDNPRGVVFLKTVSGLGTSSSVFQVSATPDGTAIDITSNMTGIFQVADLVARFSGSNLDPDAQVQATLFTGASFEFDGDNSTSASFTVNSITGLGNITLNANTNWTAGQMVLYSSTGTPATGLTNNTTYWVSATNVQTNLINISDSPGGATLTAISGGTGTQTFTSIAVSLDRDILAVPGHDFAEADMVQYSYPAGGKLEITGDGSANDYFFIERVYDSTHVQLTRVKGFTLDGTSQLRAAPSAQAIKNVNPSATDGTYWIKPAGSANAYETYCNFSLESGGWTQVMKLSSNTLLTNGITALGAGVQGVGAQYTFAPHWDGWLWNSENQYVTLFPLANNANFTDIDSFSPLFHLLPFNDIMVVSINDTSRRVGWRHNATILNMRSVTGATNQTTYGDQWLFPNVVQEEYSWVRRLQTVASVSQFQSQVPTVYGFKILSDRANNYGSINSYITGGYTTDTSSGVTGHGVSMIGMGGTTNTGGRWGGGIGFSYTANSQWRAHGHWWNQGVASGGASNRTFTGLAVFVR